MDQRFRNSRPREQVSSSWFVVWIISRSLIERLAERYRMRLLFAPRPVSRIEFDKISFFAESYRKNIWVRSRVPTRKSASFDPTSWKRCCEPSRTRFALWQKHRRKLSFPMSVTMSVRDHCIRPEVGYRRCWTMDSFIWESGSGTEAFVFAFFVNASICRRKVMQNNAHSSRNYFIFVWNILPCHRWSRRQLTGLVKMGHINLYIIHT